VVVTTDGPLLLGSSTSSTLSWNLSPAGGDEEDFLPNHECEGGLDSSVSNDGGDDSADDLDESQPEDSSTGRSKSCRKVVDIRQGLLRQ
jgi:hypothetical protein